MHVEELQDLFSLPNTTGVIKSKGMRWAEHVGSSGQHRMHTRASEACEVNRPLVKPRCRQKGDIKLHHKEVGWDDVDWIVLAQDGDKRRTFAITVMNLMVS